MLIDTSSGSTERLLSVADRAGSLWRFPKSRATFLVVPCHYGCEDHSTHAETQKSAVL